MELPGVGRMVLDRDLCWYFSDPVSTSALRGATGRVVVSEDVMLDDGLDFVNDAVQAFLSSDDTALREATADVFAYFLDTMRAVRDQGWDHVLPKIDDPSAVWEHVRFGSEFHVDRGSGGDDDVYVSIECECAWEQEHGLQLVFRRGRAVTKVGPYDGHLTNASAYGREELRDAVYVSPFAL